MVEEHKKANPPEIKSENALGSNANSAEHTSAAKPDVLDSILGGILDDSDDDGPPGEDADETIREMCVNDIHVFLMFKSFKMNLRNNENNYNCPLTWWKKYGGQFTTCAALAATFLAIPATSAPSERVWSRAARILTAKRNRMKQDVTQAMMFCRENKNLLHKHFALLAKERMNEKDHWLIDAHKAMLPTFEDDDEDENVESNIDVGGED